MNIAVALIKKVFDYFVWVAFFGFLLLGVMIYVTNNTLPGDKMYPFKLKFEEFVLLTSKVLNKQIDFSIDLVSKRSNEVAKILTPNNSAETLNRLDTQVELTAASIAQISDPVEKKKAAEQYIVKLNEASTILTEKQKEFSTPTSSSNTQSAPTREPTTQQNTSQSASTPTATPTIQQTASTSQAASPTPLPTTNIFPTPTTLSTTTNENVTQQINNSQETIQQAIVQMSNIAIDNRDLKKEHKPEKEPTKKPDEKNIKDVTVEDIKKLKNKLEDSK